MSIQQEIEMIIEDPGFLEIWEGMIESKAIETTGLKTICASFYWMGFEEHGAWKKDKK